MNSDRFFLFFVVSMAALMAFLGYKIITDKTTICARVECPGVESFTVTQKRAHWYTTNDERVALADTCVLFIKEVRP